jgi:two-component system response regulator HydG
MLRRPADGVQARLSAIPGPHTEAKTPVRVLVIDDEPALLHSIERVLQQRGLVVTTADRGPAGLELLQADPPDVVLVDYMMPQMDGLTVLSRVKELAPGVEVIMMTANADLETAVRAMKGGAFNFLSKPLESNDALVLSVMAAADHSRLTHHARELEQQLEARERFGELIGTSPGMLEVYRIIGGVATTSSTILVLGESGTGKELVARAIHANSPRVHGPLVAVNCAAIPKDLVESELFGHVRGAFTGAQTARAGLFETAHGGTLMLDEVGDLPLSAQVSLLRALESGEIKRVGSDETRTVDVRVIAATNVDLRAKIQAGTFRADLFYRLNVIALRLPPLRERGDDVLLLAGHFLHKLAVALQRPLKDLSGDARRALLDYAWPGNVRELEHALEHAFVLSQGTTIHASDLPFDRSHRAVPPASASTLAVAARTPSGAHAVARPAVAPAPGTSRALELPVSLLELPYAEAKKRAMGLFDDAYVGALMQRTGGNTSEAARQAGLDRSNFKRIARKSRDG